MRAAIAAILVWIVTAGVSAQWIRYPSAGVPKGADGKPNLSAPVPRAADGRPDFSGVWLVDGFGPPGAEGTGPVPRTVFFDVAHGLNGQRPPYLPWAAKLRDDRREQEAKDNPDARCLPLGPLQMLAHPLPKKIIQMPGLLVLLHERNMEFRQIFLDGRPLPEVDDNLQPWWYGYSVGHWEGDTLVVESDGFRDDGWLDVYGSPLTDKGKLTERWRRPDFGHLEIDITVDDPKAYTKPFTVRVSQQLTVDQELIEFICNENEKSSQHYDQ